MEVTTALISLLAAVIGLVTALVSAKQVAASQNQNKQDAAADGAEAAVSNKPQDSENQSLESGANVAGSSSLDKRWYDKTGWLVLWFIIFYPVGFYGLAKSRNVRKAGRLQFLFYSCC